MTIKGFFFDIYGTLLIYNNMSEAWTEWVSIFYKSLKNHGLELSKELFALHCDGFFGKPEPPAQKGELTIFERRINVLCKNLGLELKKKGIQDVATSCINAWQKFISLDPDTLPVLKTLKKNKILAVISNFDHPPHIYSLLSDLNLYEFFDSIIISGVVGVKKPNPSIFSFALKQTGLLPNEVVFIGDAPEDIQGANAAGIYSILIQRNHQIENPLITDFNLNPKDSFPKIQKSTINASRTISKLTELIEMFQ
ncbi:MAG: HAD family hydrolase [Promethearchaeota archaeon]